MHARRALAACDIIKRHKAPRLSEQQPLAAALMLRDVGWLRHCALAAARPPRRRRAALNYLHTTTAAADPCRSSSTRQTCAQRRGAANDVSRGEGLQQ